VLTEVLKAASTSTSPAGPPVVIEGLARAGERVLADIEALEDAKARVEADLLTAYGALHTIEAQQIAALPAKAASRVGRHGVSRPDRDRGDRAGDRRRTGEVARRLALATSPRRHRAVLAALRLGQPSLYRALQVSSETAPLSDADVATVEAAVLAPSRDGWPVTQRTFMTRLRRAVASVDPRGTDERRARAKTRRGVFGRFIEDGMGCLTVVALADAVAAVMNRLDTDARALRGAGDPRTLDQLRCDLATEALLRGHLEAHTGGADTDPATAPSSVTGEAAGLVWLVVPVEVATGDSDAACELPGHGWVTAAHAREVMTRPGSVWRTLPVDVRTGQAISRPTPSYRPTRAMVEHVQAVDGTCRGPGCDVLATRCDLDHEKPWPIGETSVGNLFSKHRLHHNVKTDGIWTSEAVADDGLEWTTLTGRTYTTHPKDWREGLDPPLGTGVRAEPGRRVMRPTVDEPPPF
jgi:hypothetical protein